MTGKLDRARSRAWRVSTALLLLAGFAVASPSCSNRATFVCEVLNDCELLNISVDQCIDRIGLAYQDELLQEDAVGHCLDCIVETPCDKITGACFEHECKEVLEAIQRQLEAGGEGGQGGQGGQAGEASE